MVKEQTNVYGTKRCILKTTQTELKARYTHLLHVLQTYSLTTCLLMKQQLATVGTASVLTTTSILNELKTRCPDLGTTYVAATKTQMLLCNPSITLDTLSQVDVYAVYWEYVRNVLSTVQHMDLGIQVITLQNALRTVISHGVPMVVFTHLNNLLQLPNTETITLSITHLMQWLEVIRQKVSTYAVILLLVLRFCLGELGPYCNRTTILQRTAHPVVVTAFHQRLTQYCPDLISLLHCGQRIQCHVHHSQPVDTPLTDIVWLVFTRIAYEHPEIVRMPLQTWTNAYVTDGLHQVLALSINPLC